MDVDDVLGASERLVACRREFVIALERWYLLSHGTVTKGLSPVSLPY
jgi:hypothetical protein